MATSKNTKFQFPQAQVLVFNQHGKAIQITAEEMVGMREDRELIRLFKHSWWTFTPQEREESRQAHRWVHS